MRVINKHPEYIKSSDRIKKLNQAYTYVFRAINKIDASHNAPDAHKQKNRRRPC